MAINAIPAAALPAMGVLDYAGIAVWLGGFAMEVIADRQKNQWHQAKDDKKHHEDFIHSGLWAMSRHPNYAGEATLWTGAFITASHVLSTMPAFYPSWAGAAALSSPIFITLLLLKVC